MTIPAPALSYVLDQGREPPKDIPLTKETLIVVGGVDFPVWFGTGSGRRCYRIYDTRLQHLVGHVVTNSGSTVPQILFDPVNPTLVRIAEGILHQRGDESFDLVIVTPDGRLDPEKPMRIVQEVRRACRINKTVTGHRVVCTATELLQALSKNLDIGIGVWPQTPDNYLAVDTTEIVPGFHSSLRKIMEGGARQANDALLPRNIRLD